MSYEPALVLESFSTDGHGGIPNSIIDDAAALFSANYGLWGPLAEAKVGPSATWGKRILMSSMKLRSQCLPAGAESNTCIRALKDGEIVGHVLASRWLHNGRSQICWITQLVVSRGHREQRIASTLLACLRNSSDDALGVCSAHPATIRAALRAFGNPWDRFSLSTTQQYAASVMMKSPVDYVRSAKLRGALFDQSVTDGTICCVDTDFFVDHAESDRAIERLTTAGEWELGPLPEGHEFLLFIKTRRTF